MKKLFIIFLLSCISTLVYAEDWPTKLAEVGCSFEFVEKIGEHKTFRNREVTELLPFPQVRIQRVTKGMEKEAEKNQKFLDFIGKTDAKGGIVSNIFCGDRWCGDSIDSFKNQQEALFPLKVGNRIEIPAITKTVVEILEHRKSNYFENTNEYLIQTSINLGSNTSSLTPAHRIWWNKELGFYTEIENIRLMTHEKLINTTCDAF